MALTTALNADGTSPIIERGDAARSEPLARQPVEVQMAPEDATLAPTGHTDEPLAGTSTAGEAASPALQPGEVAHVPVNVRNLSLIILTTFAGLFVLHWAKAVFIPFMLGLLFSYALSPLVNWAESRHVPRWLGAMVLMVAVLGGLGTAAYSLSDEATKLVESLPAAAQKVTQTMRARNNTSKSTLETVQKAAAQIEQAAQEGSATVNPRGAMRVVVEASRFNIKDYLWSGTLGLAALIGQLMAVIFLTYFLMVAGDSFRRKLVKMAGPSLSTKKITLQALHEITGQIQRYLQVQLFTSALVGIVTGLTFAWFKLENAAVWAIAAAILNLIPYVGSVITAGAAALVGFLQFGSLNMAAALGGASLFIHTIIGNLLTPWLTSRASRLNPVAVFVGLLAWGWLWGVWGLLLGIPIMMIVKSACDRVDELKPVGEFLGS
ncbi:MAG: family transporter [Polaromonas sp.]|jgi:predicted PurR-regulated permease PerM|nr:family transporter [Polaromonas sp.]